MPLIVLVTRLVRLRRRRPRLSWSCCLLAALLLALTLHLAFHLLITDRMVDGWDRNTNRHVPDYVRPNENTVLIFPRVLDPFLHNSLSSGRGGTADRGDGGVGNGGGQGGWPRPLFCLVFVHSAVGNWRQRRAIRRTWIPHLQEARRQRKRDNVEHAHATRDDDEGEFAVVFLTGSPFYNGGGGDAVSALHAESRAHGDILAQDFVDSYANLTVKAAMMLKFLHECRSRNGMHVQYVLKVDDDVFANLDMVPRALSQAWSAVFAPDLGGNASLVSLPPPPAPARGIMVGVLFRRGEPFRRTSIFDPRQKWICPHWIYPHEYFPDYMQGTGYLLSANLSRCLYASSLRMPLFPFEDVFLTGQLGQRCRAAKVDSPNFTAGSWRESNGTKLCSVDAAAPDFVLVHLTTGTGNVERLGDFVERDAGRTAVLEELARIVC